MSQVPTKIVLKSTTKMSLNDRFTHIQKTRPQPTVQNIRGNMMSQQQQSVRNQRQNQQNINRPGLQQQSSKLKQKSLKQRLGSSNIKARLNFGAVRGRGVHRGNFQNQGGLRGQSRGNRRGGRQLQQRGGRGGGFNRQQSMSSLNNSNDFTGRNRGGFNPRFNNQRGRGGNRGNRGRGGMRGRGSNNRDLVTSRGQALYRGRGRGQRGRSNYLMRNFNDENRGGGRGRRGARGMRGAQRGRGRGGRGGLNGKPPTAEELDNQLDAYMSKTKSHLDSELDHYMAEANPNS